MRPMADQAIERTTIDAAPERCFEVALDFERYPEWADDIKEVRVLRHDDDGRGGEVHYRAAAMGRSTSYTLRYYYGTNPLRLAWWLVQGDLIQRMDGSYLFEPVPGAPDKTDLTYQLSVDLRVPLPGFVKRRAEAKIMHTALDELRIRVETAPLAE